MKLTNFTDYSLRVLIYLATEPGRRATIAEIARTFDVSESHLMKVEGSASACGRPTS
jgi:Rrf2 family transcriptional regulator, nitric oxide-sensitive transcriptional repressor